MSRSMVVIGAFWITLFPCGVREAAAQNIERGRLKSIDVAKKVLVVTAEGQDRELVLTDRTRVLDAAGETLAQKLANFHPGVEINFVAAAQDGREVAQGLRLIGDGPGRGGNDLRRGKLTRVDAERRTLTLEVDGKRLELWLSDRTRVQGGRGPTPVDQIGSLPKDALLEFLTATRDGKEFLAAIRVAQGVTPGQSGGTGQRVSTDHAGFKPLTEMGDTQYQGFTGGLYPDGKNDRPPEHESAGRKFAEAVRPLDPEGKPREDGSVVLLSLGMSNCSQVSEGFQQQLLAAADELNPRFQFVNGAQGGMTAEVIQDPADDGRGQRFWTTVDERLKQAGVTRLQVQAVWMKHADAGPRQGFPEYPRKLAREMKRIVQIVAERFPNARLCYLSSRTYGGFATTPLNPEPVAYESGFAVKWLIEEQLQGDPLLNYDPARGAVKSPWLSWGPYLWANGPTKRADGFYFEPTDFAGDGTHHARGGMVKTGELLRKFFQSDSTTRPWFLAR